MSLKNTKHNYGTIAKWLHWSTASLFLGAYASVYFRHWFTQDDTPLNWTALQLHLSFGVTIGVIVTLRVIWRNMNRVPDEEPGSKMEHLTAHAGHYTLYAVMIILPITGYMGTGVDTEYFFLFDVPAFDSTQAFESLIAMLGVTPEAFEEPLDFVHKEILGKWVAWILILGHVTAALYHHYVKKDRTLQKMTLGK